MQDGARTPVPASASLSKARHGRAVAIPCGCKDRKSLTPDSTALTRTYPRPDDETNTIALQSSSGCTEPYSGPFRKTTVFLVGIGTDSEQLFARADRTAAINKARSEKLTFDQVLAGQLCTDVVDALFAS